MEGAEVIVKLERHCHGDGEPSEELARGRSGPDGIFGFATPAEIDSSQIAVQVRAEGFNPRRLRLDGSGTAPDLRAALYGDARRSGV